MIKFLTCEQHLTIEKKYKQMNKGNLPSKICVTCNKPFNWRKKWERDWDNVKYCSERCRRNKLTEIK